MSKLLHALRPRIDGNLFLKNPDGTNMSRRDVCEYLGLSYSYGCKLLRETLDARSMAECKVGPLTMFVANPYDVYENPNPSPTLISIFKSGGAAE